MFAGSLKLVALVAAVFVLSSCVAGAAQSTGGHAAAEVSAPSVAGPGLPLGLPLLAGPAEISAAYIEAEDGHSPRARWVVRVHSGSTDWAAEAVWRLRAVGFTHVGRVRPNEPAGTSLWMRRGDVTVHARLESGIAGPVVYTVTQPLTTRGERRPGCAVGLACER